MVSDNGASGEGGPNGSVNENKFVQRHPRRHRLEPAQIDDLGSPTTYHTLPDGLGDGLQHPVQVVEALRVQRRHERRLHHLLADGTKARGEFVTSTTTPSTCPPPSWTCWVQEAPESIKGHVQTPFDGVSMRYSFDAPGAPSTRSTQFYAMLGSRSIWHDGWKAVTTHPTIAGWSNFGADTWELYHTDVDRSEVHNLAEQEPERLHEMINLWHAEAGANGAFPLDDRGGPGDHPHPRPVLTPGRNRYVYYPGLAEVPESQAVNVRNRSYAIGALVDIPAPGASGVLFAHGARFGGHALYIKDNRLHYVYNFVGMAVANH